jgi:tetratricopeptide (TPR) repeat protein
MGLGSIRLLCSVSLSRYLIATTNSDNSTVACKERGNALYKQKKFEEAIAAYEEAFAIDPTNIMYLNNKAAVLIEMGKYIYV